MIENTLAHLVLYEIASPTKVVVHFELDNVKDIQFFLEHQLKKIMDLWNIQKIIVGRHIPSNYFDGDRFRYLAKKNLSWEFYLYQINWNKEIQQEDEKFILSWEHPISSTSLQICELCERYNFVI